MRAQQVHLQFANLIRSDAHIAQLANAGGDGICQAVFTHQFLDDLAGLRNFLPRIGRQQHWTTLMDDIAKLAKRELVSIDMQRSHATPRYFPPSTTMVWPVT